MAKPQDIVKVKITPIRKEGGSRIYSNYVRVISSARDITFQFCDVKPPESDEEATNIKKSAIVKPQIDAEVVLPFDIAQSLLTILKGQLEKVSKKTNGEKK